jgi:hypothetical protein
VSVFLRWGILGILSVAALVYVYNATKHMAEVRAAKAAQAPAPQPAPSVTTTEPARPVVEPERSPAPPPAATAPAHCENELVVAKRAIEMKKAGEPLDRVLRIQEVAWQEPAERRARLEVVATRWFGYDGEFNPEALRIAVISDCVQHSPAP